MDESDEWGDLGIFTEDLAGEQDFTEIAHTEQLEVPRVETAQLAVSEFEDAPFYVPAPGANRILPEQAQDLAPRHEGTPDQKLPSQELCNQELRNQELCNQAQQLRIQAWTWNTESVRFAESESQRRDATSLDWQSGLPLPALSCESPEFLRRIVERVNERQPHLLIFAFQEEAKPGSYLLSHALPAALGSYTLLARTRLMGVGLTTWTKWTMRGLRLGVFARSSWLAELPVRPSVDAHQAVCSGMSEWTRNKGGVGLVVDLPPPYGRLDIVNVHLPFDSSSLGTWRERSAALQPQIEALEKLYSELVLGIGQPLPDHVLLLGDLNFRIDPFQLANDPQTIGPQGEVDRVLGELARSGANLVYQERDELKQVLQSSTWLSELREGVENRGPEFWPTCKLRKERPLTDLAETASFEQRLQWLKATFQIQAQHGKRGPRTPGWADRILFRSYGQRHGPSARDSGALQCSAYERWDLSASSDHAAVFAELEIGAK